MTSNYVSGGISPQIQQKSTKVFKGFLYVYNGWLLVNLMAGVVLGVIWHRFTDRFIIT